MQSKELTYLLIAVGAFYIGKKMTERALLSVPTTGLPEPPPGLPDAEAGIAGCGCHQHSSITPMPLMAGRHPSRSKILVA